MSGIIKGQEAVVDLDAIGGGIGREGSECFLEKGSWWKSGETKGLGGAQRSEKKVDRLDTQGNGLKCTHITFYLWPQSQLIKSNLFSLSRECKGTRKRVTLVWNKVENLPVLLGKLGMNPQFQLPPLLL